MSWEFQALRSNAEAPVIWSRHLPCRCEGCRNRIRGIPGFVCYNPLISGEYREHNVAHIKTWTLEESTEKKKNDKETRKEKAAQKAKALLSQGVAHREDHLNAPNPTAARQASIALSVFPSSGSPKEPIATSQSSSSSSSKDSLNTTENDEAFTVLYHQFDIASINSEFNFTYEDEEGPGSDIEE
jgi:hypothetical protein